MRAHVKIARRDKLTICGRSVAQLTKAGAPVWEPHKVSGACVVQQVCRERRRGERSTRLGEYGTMRTFYWCKNCLRGLKR